MNTLLSDDEICTPELMADIAKVVKTKAFLKALKAAQMQAAKDAKKPA